MALNSNKPFDLNLLPPELNQNDLFQPELVKLLIRANRSISELNGTCRAVPNSYNLLMNIPILCEVRASSAIEGIHTTIESILEGEIKKERDSDPATKEALQYKRALRKGYESFKKTGSISTRTIKEVHKELMSNGGSFKKQINQIKKGSDEVLYTPPSPDKINELMSNWDDYVNEPEGKIDPLIKIAVSHYQFESIHPFSDGNGRTGRIAVVLQMLRYRLLDLPVLYISGYLIKNKKEYYSCLLNVTKSNQWMELITFFLIAFDEQAKVTRGVILNILKAKDETKVILKDKHRLIYSKDFLDHIFSNPVTHATFLAKQLDITYQTAGKYLSALEVSGLLKKKRSGSYILYYNLKLLNCLVT